MNEPHCRPLKEVAPPLIAFMERLLNEAGETALAAQVSELTIVERHEYQGGCDYYAVTRPIGWWGPDHRTIGLLPGALHVDVVHEKIVCIEILRGPRGFSPDLENA